MKKNSRKKTPKSSKRVVEKKTSKELKKSQPAKVVYSINLAGLFSLLNFVVFIGKNVNNFIVLAFKAVKKLSKFTIGTYARIKIRSTKIIQDFKANTITALGRLLSLLRALKDSAVFPRFVFPKPVLPKIQVSFPKFSLVPKSFGFKGFLSKIFKKELKFFIFGILFTVLFVYLPLNAYIWAKQLPNPELLAEVQNKSTRILDRKGRLLYEIYVDRQYEPIALDSIPDHLVKATLAVEDSEFYTHSGIRFSSMIRAAKAIVLDDTLQGGSTITQQLIKNVLLSPERTISRKVKEVILALAVERKYSKNEILELYFNNIPYGGTSWGIQSASTRFFGKSVSDLTLAEGSLLAGLPSAPSIYSPTSGDFSLAKKRQKFVLDRMVQLGYISRYEASQAYEEDLNFAEQISYIRAPHFVNAVRDALIAKFGKRMVDFGGLTVLTTLDLDLQNSVQDIVTSQVAGSSGLNISNGAAVVLDARSGEILAYVGSVDYFDSDGGAFDVARAFRQPGSSIKILTYAQGLEEGLTAATVLEDSPLTIQYDGQTYTPKNYDGRFHGRVTLRQAFANSYNIPAVKVLRTVGLDDMVTLGKMLGLTGWEIDNSYGWAITLGGKETRLVDLVNMYASFARQGKYKDIKYFLSVRDMKGFELLESNSLERQVLSPETAYIVSDILSDNNARVAAFGPNSALVVPGYKVAVKTGTTDENRDNLTLGYTPTYAVGVWVGNNDNSPMNRNLVSGLSGAAPIWNSIMRTLLAGTKAEVFEKPETVVVKVDKKCDYRSEVFVKGTEPDSLCIKKEKNSDRR